MSISAGARLGPYHLVGPLGSGGMGEVYRAADSRLKRQVALKILPPALAADPDRLARFQREAEVLASLNHPHIAAIYGLEDGPDVKALVMELVEGPTLADRIAQGPIPLDEALPIARQIAEALEAAHEQGIIHRDLKPANIKVRDDGTVKVLDFGLAKLTESGASSRASQGDPAQSPTLTSPAAVTGIGLILGTAAYMSPEQARGRAVDKRTDVWAFGAVLYEMLTGRRAFAGEHTTDVIAEVVKSAPDWSALPANVPPQVVTLVQRCLEKDRNARIGDIAVARFLLADHGSVVSSLDTGTHVSHETASRGRQTMMWMLAAVVAGTSIGWLIPRRPSGGIPVTYLDMSVRPADHLVGSTASVRPARTAVALSPDGRTLVLAGARDTVGQLYVRGLDRADATPLAGTEGANGPFFSADGAWVGFWADNKIKKVPATGGSPATITDVPAADQWGASWSEDGTIFFAGRTGMSRVSAAGGSAATLTTADVSKSERHLLPHSLPGGKGVLFTAMTATDWESANVVLLSLETGERRVLIPGGADARYVSSGHLVYLRSGTLMAVPFDLRSLQVTGTPVMRIEGVMQAVNAPNSGDETGAGQFSVAANGTLLYVVGGVTPNLESSWVWVDRKGAAQPVTAVRAGPYLFPRLSPDEQKVAVNVRRGASKTADVWVYDLHRGAPARLTFEGNNSSPVWSPDGKRLVYSARTTGAPNLYIVNADGSGEAERLTTSDFAQIPSSWARATDAIAFLQRPETGSFGIWVIAMDGDRKPQLFLESRFSLTHAEFSPDGRWLAYVSTESGDSEVYVRPYPGPGEKIRISTAGGTEPVWSANGRELLYRSGSQGVFSTAITALSPFRAAAPRPVLEVTPGEYDSTFPVRSWNISDDGQRFLLSRFAQSKDTPVTEMRVILNWADELRDPGKH